MKFKRFLALVVSLAMVLSIVPTFSLTASAATDDAYVIDFDIYDIGYLANDHRDIGITDNDGYVVTGFCFGDGRSNNGFWAFDGERSFNGDGGVTLFREGNAKTSSDAGTQMVYNGTAHITVTITVTDDGYNVSYTNGTITKNGVYTGVVNGIQDPSKWAMGTRWANNPMVNNDSIGNYIRNVTITKNGDTIHHYNTSVFEATDDAHAQAVDYGGNGPNTVFGNDAAIYVSRSSWGNHRKAYVQFENVTADSGAIKRAYLALTTSAADGNVNPLYIKGITTGDVDETSLTWNTSASLTLQDIARITSIPSAANGTFAVDVTAFVKGKLDAGESTIGFGILPELSNGGTTHNLYMHSSEATTAQARPTLVIETYDRATTTIKYMCGETSIKDNKVVDGFVTDVIDLTAEANAPVVIVKDGVVYAKDSATPISYTVNETGEIVINYNIDTIESVETPEGVTTRYGVAPILPETVMATFSSGASSEVSVEWQTENEEWAADGILHGNITGYEPGTTIAVSVLDKDTYLIAHYAFDDEENITADSSSLSKTAIEAKKVNVVDGLYGKAIQTVGGSNGTSYFHMADNVLADANGNISDDFTVSMFINRESQGNSFAMILHASAVNAAWNSDGSKSGPEDHLGLINKNDFIDFEFRKGRNTQTNLRKDDGGNTPVGEWVHIAISSSAKNQTAKLYINGELVGTKTGVAIKPSDLTAQNNYLARASWSDNDYMALFDDVKFYSVALEANEIADIGAKRSVEIQYQYDNATVATETVTGFVGETVTLPAVVTATSGKRYDNTNTSYIITDDATDIVAVVPSKAQVVSVEAVTAKVIEGNNALLPETVTVTFDDSSTQVLNVTWDSVDTSTAGDKNVSGTLDIAGEFNTNNIKATATVTVLAETFTIGDLSSTNGKVAYTNAFPGEITGDFVFEFDYTSAQNGDDWIYISKNQSESGMWGSGNLAIGVGNNKLKAPNALGGSPAEQISNAFTVGETYHFRVIGNTLSNSYSIIVTDASGNVINDGSETYYFRTNDTTNGIPLNYINIRGGFTMSNIQVNSPALESLFTTYTVTIEGAGANDGTYTEKATWLEGVAIPYFEGYIFEDREVSGTNITYTYQAQADTWGTWAIRNNVPYSEWVTEMKFLGTHDSFANTNTPFTNEGGVLYKTTGAGEGNVSISRAQTLSALGQLNAGARYFDIRSSRQNDGSFVTVHGDAFNYLRPILTSIAQFAKENPGEVIFLDFQSMTDALYTTVVSGGNNGGSQGDDNEAVYAALVQLLRETGIMDYAISTNQDVWDKSYGVVTDNGTKTAIYLFCKGRGASAQSGVFINRAKFNGDTYQESSALADATYSDVVDKINSVVNDTGYSDNGFGGGAAWGVVHAYTTPMGASGLSTKELLIENAASDNPKFVKEANFDSWMQRQKGDIIILNGLTEEIGKLYIDQLSEYNRDRYDDMYGQTDGEGVTQNGVNIKAATSAVPFSTKLVVTGVDAEGAVAGDYTYKTRYNIAFNQFDTTSVATGDLTLTFPKVSVDNSTVDVLLDGEGSLLYEAPVGQAVTFAAPAGDFILATKAAPDVNMTINYVDETGAPIYTYAGSVAIGAEAYNFAAGDQYAVLGDKAYIVNSAEEQRYVATADDIDAVKTVTLTVVSDNAVLRDTFYQGTGNNNNSTDMLFVGSVGNSKAPGTDADNAATTTKIYDVGSSRVPVLDFKVPTVGAGESVKLNVFVAKSNGNLGVGNSMKLAVNVANISANEEAGRNASDFMTVENIVWSDTMLVPTEALGGNLDRVEQWLTFDVTEFVEAAEGDTITFALYAPTAGAYVVDREKAVAGGSYAGKAAYLEVVDAREITVTGSSKVTKNGNAVTLDANNSFLAYDGATIKLYETNALTPAFADGVTVYKTDDTTGETAAIAVGADAVYYAAELGVNMVDGAQVRIGKGVTGKNENGVDILEGSGLRFIAQVVKDNTLAGIEGVEIGVRITAEESANHIDIAATNWQDAYESAFTVAMTDILPTNYNREFTATPYVKVGDDYYLGNTTVTRSIYKVAAGLLTNNLVDDSYTEGALQAQSMIDVLNTYVNQTGIRLSITDSGLAVYNGSNAQAQYSGDVFFEIISTDIPSENVYVVTIKPIGSKTEIKGYWNEFIRINNNNSKIKGYTTMTNNDDGSVTITFDRAAMNAAQ